MLAILAADPTATPRSMQRIWQMGPGYFQPVSQAVAILMGTNFGFSPTDDHHLGKVITRLYTSIDDDVVIVTGAIGVRDWSGTRDDDYESTVYFAVLAE